MAVEPRVAELGLGQWPLAPIGQLRVFVQRDLEVLLKQRGQADLAPTQDARIMLITAQWCLQFYKVSEMSSRTGRYALRPLPYLYNRFIAALIP